MLSVLVSASPPGNGRRGLKHLRDAFFSPLLRIASRQREAWIETGVVVGWSLGCQSIASRQREAWIETFETAISIRCDGHRLPATGGVD